MSGEWEKTKRGWLCAVVAGLLSIYGCAGPNQLLKDKGNPSEDADAADVDPWSPFNHAVYKFNSGVDMLILKPITTGYRYIVPQQGRVIVSNVLDNLYTPVVFGNSVLQGDPQNSFATLWRFILNSTFGLGGMIDYATAAGLKNRPADFGETLAMWGVGTGPYVVLPFIGPSDARDACGRLADVGMDPFTYMPYQYSIPKDAMMVIDTRSRNSAVIDDINANSIDPYETFRSAYTQKRAADIRKAEVSRQKALDQAPTK